jgi:hypothetical protein
VLTSYGRFTTIIEEIGIVAKQLATGLMILLSAGTAIAANAPEIRTMAGKDFSRYISYAWAPKRDLVEGHPLTDGSPLDVKIKSAADRELVAKGYQRTGPDGDPSLIINYVGVAIDQLKMAGTTIGSGSVKWIGDPRAHETRSYREGTLVFEVVDAETDEMVWSGWLTELAATSEKLQSKAPKATTKIFKHFPAK